MLFIIFLLPVILHTDLIVKLEKMGLNIQISALIILTLVFLCPFIHGWGIDGHFTICRIAQVTSIYTQISSFFFFFIYVLEFKILGFQCFSHMIWLMLYLRRFSNSDQNFQFLVLFQDLFALFCAPSPPKVKKKRELSAKVFYAKHFLQKTIFPEACRRMIFHCFKLGFPLLFFVFLGEVKALHAILVKSRFSPTWMENQLPLAWEGRNTLHHISGLLHQIIENEAVENEVFIFHSL